MNFILHFLIAYFSVDVVFGNASQYFIYIFFFSTFLDLDHIPYMMRVKKELIHKKFGSESRTRFHEIYGIALFSVLLSAFSFFINPELVQIAAVSLMMHYASDFLLGKTRPFYPFSGKEVFLHLCSQKSRMIFEIIATLSLGVLLIWQNMAS